MEMKKLPKDYFDLKTKETNHTEFFFLEHILKARADLKLESGHHSCDQEINVYLAGLLNMLLDTKHCFSNKPYLSSVDSDVRKWLDKHPGNHNEYIVYRDNADFGLIFSGIFSSYDHRGSYYHIVMPESMDYSRIAIYYELAASALMHIQRKCVPLVLLFEAISEYLNEILLILRKAAHCYFDLIERISEGSIYHLEREVTEQSLINSYNKKLDEFLLAYKKYQKTPSMDLKNELISLTTDLRSLNSNFKFDTESL
jgi:hypothetical protein